MPARICQRGVIGDIRRSATCRRRSSARVRMREARPSDGRRRPAPRRACTTPAPSQGPASSRPCTASRPRLCVPARRPRATATDVRMPATSRDAERERSPVGASVSASSFSPRWLQRRAEVVQVKRLVRLFPHRAFEERQLAARPARPGHGGHAGSRVGGGRLVSARARNSRSGRRGRSCSSTRPTYRRSG